MNYNKISYIADIVYGRYPGISNTKENARIEQSRDGNYIVKWTENGMEKMEYLAPQELAELHKLRDSRFQAEERLSQYYAERDKQAKQQEETDRMREEIRQRTVQKEEQAIIDRQTAKNLKSTIDTVNQDYQKVQIGMDGYVNKLLRDYQAAMDVILYISTPSIRKELIEQLDIAHDNFKKQVSLKIATANIDRIQEMSNNDYQRFHNSDLRRAKLQAKKRLDKLSPLQRAVAMTRFYTIDRQVLKGNNPEQIDELYQGEQNGRSR